MGCKKIHHSNASRGWCHKILKKLFTIAIVTNNPHDFLGFLCGKIMYKFYVIKGCCWINCINLCSVKLNFLAFNYKVNHGLSIDFWAKIHFSQGRALSKFNLLKIFWFFSKIVKIKFPKKVKKSTFKLRVPTPGDKNLFLSETL